MGCSFRLKIDGSHMFFVKPPLRSCLPVKESLRWFTQHGFAALLLRLLPSVTKKKIGRWGSQWHYFVRCSQSKHCGLKRHKVRADAQITSHTKHSDLNDFLMFLYPIPCLPSHLFYSAYKLKTGEKMPPQLVLPHLNHKKLFVCTFSVRQRNIWLDLINHTA